MNLQWPGGRDARQRTASLCRRTTATFQKATTDPSSESDHNHEMKEIFKSTALSASRCAGPLQDFYAGLLAKGMKPIWLASRWHAESRPLR